MRNTIIAIMAAGLSTWTGCGAGSVEDLASSRPAEAEKAVAASRPAGEDKSMATSQPAGSIYGFTMKDIDGHDKSLGDYKGKALLVVNVASKCGYTKQYTGLEELFKKYKDRGLVIVGFPSNDFGGQEPGTEADIKQFCSTKYNVTFPLMAKSSVENGPDQNAVYQYLTQKSRNGVLDAEVKWNFNKFLVSRDGRVVRYYESKVAPESPELQRDIELALQK